MVLVCKDVSFYWSYRCNFSAPGKAFSLDRTTLFIANKIEQDNKKLTIRVHQERIACGLRKVEGEP